MRKSKGLIGKSLHTWPEQTSHIIWSKVYILKEVELFQNHLNEKAGG